jgi:hypothetical protein
MNPSHDKRRRFSHRADERRLRMQKKTFRAFLLFVAAFFFIVFGLGFAILLAYRIL